MKETKIDKCFCCGFKTKLEKFNLRNSSTEEMEDYWLCEICKHSPLVFATMYPDSYPCDYNGKAAIFAANVILKEMKKNNLQLAIGLLKEKYDNDNMHDEFYEAIEYLEEIMDGF